MVHSSGCRFNDNDRTIHGHTGDGSYLARTNAPRSQVCVNHEDGEEERARAGGRYRGLPQRKIQFYKNIGLVMRNSRWVSVVAGKNLKRAEEAAGSFSARTLGPRCVPRPRPLGEKSTPSHPLHTLLSVLLASLCRERSRLRILSPSARSRLLSHLSPQRGILRSERNKEVLFSFSFARADDRDQYASIRQLLPDNSISRCSLIRVVLILSSKRLPIHRRRYDRTKYRCGITTAFPRGYFRKYACSQIVLD